MGLRMETFRSIRFGSRIRGLPRKYIEKDQFSLWLSEINYYLALLFAIHSPKVSISQKIPLTTVANALLDLLGRSAHIGKSRVTSSVYRSLVSTFL